MKIRRPILFLSLSVLLLLSACKDPCKDYDCGNGTCTDMDGEATCVCDTYFEGNRCETAVNERFIGNYTASDTCGGGGGVSIYAVSISAANGPGVFIMDNLTGSGFNHEAEVNSDGLSFIIPSQILFNGTVEGEGSIDPGTGVIRINHTTRYPGYAPLVCTATLRPD